MLKNIRRKSADMGISAMVCGLLIVLLIVLLVDDFADISWSLGGRQSVGF